MSNTVVFNRVMKKYLKSNNNEVVDFINTKFNESQSQNYFGFFDDFLYKYGIISFNASPLINGSKYVPYINCTKNNIFHEEKGVMELSSKAHSLSECQRIFAEYFISRFKNINVQTLREWNSEDNYQLN